MRAEIVEIENGGRVILSKIRPIGERDFCLEIHRGEKDRFQVFHALLTRAELWQIRTSIDALMGDG